MNNSTIHPSFSSKESPGGFTIASPEKPPNFDGFEVERYLHKGGYR